MEVLEEFPSVTLEAGVVVAALPLLQARYYSISSSPALYPGQLHLTLSGVQYQTQGKVLGLLLWELHLASSL